MTWFLIRILMYIIIIVYLQSIHLINITINFTEQTKKNRFWIKLMFSKKKKIIMIINRLMQFLIWINILGTMRRLRKHLWHWFVWSPIGPGETVPLRQAVHSVREVPLHLRSAASPETKENKTANRFSIRIILN